MTLNIKISLIVIMVLSLSLVGSISNSYADVTGTPFENPSAVTIDSNDRIIISDVALRTVQVFNPDGTFITEFDGTDGGTKFVFPFGVAVDNDDNIIVSDTLTDLIQIFNPDGTFISEFDGTDGGTKFRIASAITVDSNNRIIVSDYFGNVQIFNPDGTFITKLDGVKPNLLSITVDSKDRIIINTASSHIIQIFNPDGTFITEFDGSDGDGTKFVSLYGIAVDSVDNIFAVDNTLGTVQVFNPDGSFVDIFIQVDDIALASPTAIAIDSNDRVIILDNAIVLIEIFESDGTFVDDFDGTPVEEEVLGKKSGGGSANKHLTRPTFGISHETNAQFVTGGFTFNENTFDITDNFWTPFEIQTIKIGEVNTISSTVFAPKELHVQEFLFGIPVVGEAHKAELGIEIFYTNQGVISNVNVVQATNIIDVDSLVVTYTESACSSGDDKNFCDTTVLDMVFLEPLRHNIMALKAIDYKARTQITYLNEGFDISGDSLNPMKTMMIIGTEKYEGLIEITQTVKYSDVWVAQDGRAFKINEYGSSKLIYQTVEDKLETSKNFDRYHSEFYKLHNFEIKKAQRIMDVLCVRCADESFDNINDIFAYE